MLEELVVRNLGLIESASLEFGPGLTVVTGETGTGKTLMLGALRLLKGENAPKGLVGPHGDTLDASAMISLDAGETVIRRTISSTRSKAYLDGAIVTASALAQAMGDEIAIVGQHDQHTITSVTGIRRLVDRCLDVKGRSALARYELSWTALTQTTAEAEALGGDLRALEREAEMLSFQVLEIDDAGFDVDEEETLRSSVAKLRSAEELAAEIGTAMNELGDEGAQARLETAIRSIRRANAIDPGLDVTVANGAAAMDLIGDLLADLVRYSDDLSSDADRLAQTEDRLALLGSLKRKYGDTVEDILTFRKEAEARAGTLTALLSAAADIEARLATAFADAVAAGSELALSRKAAGRRLAADAVAHLTDLGFTDPILVINVHDAEPAHAGADTVVLQFASDSSLAPAPASAVASGGELSRLVLALTLAAGGADAAIVAFDEIDAGIGGTTALAMGKKLAALADDRQVICVTHLPQVAAHGDAHLVVTRSGTVTSVLPIEGDARVSEIARMLAGLGGSDVGQQHAAELLALAKRS